MERLRQAICPDTSQGEAAEVPRYETSRGPGSTAEVDYWSGPAAGDLRQAAAGGRPRQHPARLGAGPGLP
jgi:hypothetical protein